MPGPPKAAALLLAASATACVSAHGSARLGADAVALRPPDAGAAASAARGSPIRVMLTSMTSCAAALMLSAGPHGSVISCPRAPASRVLSRPAGPRQGDTLALGDTDAVLEGEAVSDAVTEGDTEGDAVSLGEPVGVAVTVAVLLPLTEGDAVSDALADGEPVSDALVEGEAVSETLPVLD